ncbi:hypothetical protein [Jhaorihella thermophila]|uniref:hypothetical protein n=1 Tax=Jhaorihella thermophila TaxID=488547 RepID=UPI00135AFCA6|nr:hypothetical protein [Jhaorihella thermophila]
MTQHIADDTDVFGVDLGNRRCRNVAERVGTKSCTELPVGQLGKLPLSEVSTYRTDLGV